MPILIIDNNPFLQYKFGPVKQELIELSVDSIIVLIKLILPGSIKPWVSREKATYYNSVIRIEGINPFSGAVAGEVFLLPW